jgi:hypothetical protein
MDTSTSVHASDVDPDTLRQMLAEQAAYEQAKVFRTLLLRRLALIAFVVWVLSWPAHVLPHIALWVALAIVALAVVLTAPPPQSTT